ncbi:hypothetical protein LSTR_LSTR002383 [Laodelphax striatellus]|uniref:Uncharacterized protein n=1 Tax=Laodelphax striatellus TaxID=195883 RepID=A0A482X3L6_LAOST|nr:hypothetical protein LSTR_LSTR002383 [Laodelphax striatellus]
MAFYDNKHWLLSHTRNSFISSDDTGVCEVVMAGENIARQLEFGKYDCYPGIESDEDDLDAYGQSLDLHFDMEYGRFRSNTAVRLKKMDEERKKASSVRHVKWEKPHVCLTDEEKAELFKRKDFREKRKNSQPKSLLTEQLAKNPFVHPLQIYAKFDGSTQVGVVTKKFLIYLPMLEDNNYPLVVQVVSYAKIQDLIGLIFWRCSIEHPDVVFKGIENYSLYMAEDDGEVDFAFPCLEPKENVAKFGFKILALVENDQSQARHERLSTTHILVDKCDDASSSSLAKGKKPNENNHQADGGDMERVQGDMNAIDATLFQSFQVYILGTVRRNLVHLGISGEKVEFYPAVNQRSSARFKWAQQKAARYHMDSIVACDLTETKSNKSNFRLVYDHMTNDGPVFKHHDFEVEQRTAKEIVQKVNHILDLRPSSARRKEYLALREHKSHRKKSFPLGPR